VCVCESVSVSVYVCSVKERLKHADIEHVGNVLVI